MTLILNAISKEVAFEKLSNVWDFLRTEINGRIRDKEDSDDYQVEEASGTPKGSQSSRKSSRASSIRKLSLKTACRQQQEQSPSRGVNKFSSHFLMGGIICDPYVPMKRNTTLPLTMLFPKENTNDASGTKVHQHSEDIPKQQESQKMSKQPDCIKAQMKLSLFYDLEHSTLKVRLIQFGNVQVANLSRKIRIFARVTLEPIEDKSEHQPIKAEKEMWGRERKIERSDFLDNFKYNYIFKFRNISVNELKRRTACVQLRARGRILRRKRVVKTKMLSLDSVNMDSDEEDEIIDFDIK